MGVEPVWRCSVCVWVGPSGVWGLDEAGQWGALHPRPVHAAYTVLLAGGPYGKGGTPHAPRTQYAVISCIGSVFTQGTGVDLLVVAPRDNPVWWGGNQIGGAWGTLGVSIAGARDNLKTRATCYVSTWQTPVCICIL